MLELALWYVFYLRFLFLVDPIHRFTSVFCCYVSNCSFNAPAMATPALAAPAVAPPATALPAPAVYV